MGGGVVLRVYVTIPNSRYKYAISTKYVFGVFLCYVMWHMWFIR